MVVESFSAPPVPDGNIWFPHHFVIGAWGALFVSWLLPTDGGKPWLMVGGLLVSLFGWYHAWSHYPVMGALLVLVGLTVATVALRQPCWVDGTDRKFRLLAVFFILVAWDDAISHTFGMPTPLDLVWAGIIAPWAF